MPTREPRGTRAVGPPPPPRRRRIFSLYIFFCWRMGLPKVLLWVRLLINSDRMAMMFPNKEILNLDAQYNIWYMFVGNQGLAWLGDSFPILPRHIMVHSVVGIVIVTLMEEEGMKGRGPRVHSPNRVFAKKQQKCELSECLHT